MLGMVFLCRDWYTHKEFSVGLGSLVTYSPYYLTDQWAFKLRTSSFCGSMLPAHGPGIGAAWSSLPHHTLGSLAVALLAHICQPWVGLLLAKLQSHSVLRVYSVLFSQAAEHQVTNELTERVNSWRWGKILPLSIRLEIYFKEGLKSHNLRGKLRENFSFEKDWLRFFFFPSK